MMSRTSGMRRAMDRPRRRAGRPLALLAALALSLAPIAVSPAVADDFAPDDAPTLLVEQSSGDERPADDAPADPDEPADSDEPDAPVEPDEPVDPDAPLDPDDPVDADEPGDPTEPTDPDETPGVDPLPGQSDQPAPLSEERLRLDHGHIDAFTPVRGADGGLQLVMKEDVTALNTLRIPETVILHVKPSALVTPEDLAEMPPGFLPSELPDDFYHLPLVQDHDLIWPGWETQLIPRAEYPDANTQIVVSEVDGPGEVYLWSNSAFGELRSLMHGEYRFPATIDQPFPAHTHAAWGFTEPGVYTFTVRADVTSSNGNSASTQTATYVFIVGGLETETVLSGDATEIDPGDAATFTARVTPAGSAGAVQFSRDGMILGHTPVGDDGLARFRTGALPPGEHRISAEFVPTWTDTFTPSASQEQIVVTVRGDAIDKPDAPDTIPVSDAELDAATPGEAVVVTSEGKQAPAGSAVTARFDIEHLPGDLPGGDWVSVWMHGGGSAIWLDWAQLDLHRGFAAAIPADAAPGEYRLVVKDRDGGLVGWDVFTVPAPADPDDEVRLPEDPPPSTPPPTAPPQDCRPAVTLEHGHIDAFTVSVGNGMAALQILEDVTGYRVLREPESVLLRVKESAYSSIPGLPGGPAGYVLPLTQDPNLIWPGWDTNRTTVSGYTDVRINVTGVSGPGQVFLYSRTPFGALTTIPGLAGYTLPGTIHESTPAHTHAQWVFTQPGVYVLTAHAIATNPGTGASLATSTHTYVFQVGDVPLGDIFCRIVPHGEGVSALVNQAVTQAGLEAVAAEQADAEEREEERTRDRSRSEAAGGDRDGAGSLLDALLGSGLHPAAVAGIVGGGLLALAGIVGGTVWMVRRTGADADG